MLRTVRGIAHCLESGESGACGSWALHTVWRAESLEPVVQRHCALSGERRVWSLWFRGIAHCLESGESGACGSWALHTVWRAESLEPVVKSLVSYD